MTIFIVNTRSAAFLHPSRSSRATADILTDLSDTYARCRTLNAAPGQVLKMYRRNDHGESVDRVEARAGFNTVTARVHLFRTGVMLRNQHDRQKTCC
ncbi:hypothetical protein VR010_03480 [Actinomycetaceae bacterium L2_0104]